MTVPTSASSQGSADSTLPLSTSGSPASDRSSGTPPVPESSNDTGPMSPDGPMLLPTPTSNQPGGTAEQHLARKARMPDGANRTSVTDLRMAVEQLLPTPTAGDSKSSGNRENPSNKAHDGLSLTDAVRPDRHGHRLTSSAAGSPASPSVPPASARPRTTHGGSGLSSPASFASLDPDGSWLKTSPDSSVQASLLGPLLVRFSGTWPRSGSMRDGTVYAHPTLERPTDESESSSLQQLRTPTSAMYERGGSGGELRAGILHGPTRQLPTPKASDHTGAKHHGDGGPGLREVITIDLLPTPNSANVANDGTAQSGDGRTKPNKLGWAIASRVSPGDRTKPPSEGGNE